MKKSTKLSALFFSLCISLCGCKNSDDLSAPPSSAAEISNPFENMSNDIESDPSSSGSSSNSEKEEWQNELQDLTEAVSALKTDAYTEKAEWVDNETLKLPVKLIGKGNPEVKFCPIVLCDGILVQTSMDGENFGYSECRINFAEESDNPENITHEIYLKPVFDSSLKTHFITLGYIANPDVRPDDYDMFMGALVQSYLVMNKSYDITGHEELCVDTCKALEAKPAVALTREQKFKYYIDDDSGTYLNIDAPADSQTLYAEGLSNDNIILAENSNKAKFSVVAATNEPQRTPYRVMFFVNNKPVKLNGEYDYFAFTLEGGKISETDVEIDGLKDKDIVYAVFCPMPEAPTYREWFEITNVYIVDGDK